MAYFSLTYPSVVRAWHRHLKTKQIDNMCIIQGMAKIVVYDDRPNSPAKGTINEFIMGEDNLTLLEIAERRITGILHTAGANRVSRHEFALELAKVFNLNRDLIKPAETHEMSWKAKRPKDSSLNISKANALLNTKPLKLNHALKMMKKETSKNPKN